MGTKSILRLRLWSKQNWFRLQFDDRRCSCQFSRYRNKHQVFWVFNDSFEFISCLFLFVMIVRIFNGRGIRQSVRWIFLSSTIVWIFNQRIRCICEIDFALLNKLSEVFNISNKAWSRCFHLRKLSRLSIKGFDLFSYMRDKVRKYERLIAFMWLSLPQISYNINTHHYSQHQEEERIEMTIIVTITIRMR